MGRPPESFTFGPFEVRTRSREMYKHGIKLKLRPQPFLILHELLGRPGELVTREELRDKLWSSETFVDFEQSLNTSIKELRAVLGDSATEPRYVETIPRLGYRFIAKAQVFEERASKLDADSGRISSSEIRKAARSAWLAWKRYVVLAGCIALAAAFVAHHFWSQPGTPRGEAKITKISQWDKPMNSAVLSPDGHAVAFEAPVNGIEQVFVMLTSGGEPLQLTNDEGDKGVDNFSPDCKEIYYGRDLGGDEVWAVPTLGGAPRRVASAWYVLPSPDGTSIYYDKTDRGGIFRADISGLNEELVYSPPNPDLRYLPALLFPGGKDMLAVGAPRSSENDVRTFFKINLKRHDAIALGEVSRNGDAEWSEPGKTLLFSRTINGITNIWKYSLKERSLTQITFGTGPDYSPMPDPGEKGIYYVNGKSSGFMTAYHVLSRESTDIASEEATQPAISPDGEHVMYITLPAPRKTELWVSDIYGGKQARLATGVDLQTGTWASDNFHLSYIEAGAGTASRAYILGADGSGLVQLPSTGPTTATVVWARDQKSVYVSVVDKVGALASIWKWSEGSSKMERVVENCGQGSDIDPSGKYVLGNVLEGAKTGIYELSISDGRCFPLLPGIRTFAATFALDGKSILYAVDAGGGVTIYRQPWKEGKTMEAPQVALKVPFAFPLRYGSNGNAYDFSRDLSTVVYARPWGHADLYLLSPK